MTDATEGGLATALHEMAAAAGVGFRVKSEDVPLYPETRRICAEYDLDPFGLIASGMLIMTVPVANVDELCNKMRTESVQCSVIGTVTDASEGVRISREGKSSALPYFALDELTKIM